MTSGNSKQILLHQAPLAANLNQPRKNTVLQTLDSVVKYGPYHGVTDERWQRGVS